MRRIDPVLGLLLWFGLLAGVFVWFSERAFAQDGQARGVVLFHGVLLLMSAGLATGFAGLAFLMKCGDTCDALTVFETEDTVPWHEAPGSWQWPVQMALASAALVAVLAALVFAARRRYRSATIAAASALVCLAIWVLMMEPVF